MWGMVLPGFYADEQQENSMLSTHVRDYRVGTLRRLRRRADPPVNTCLGFCTPHTLVLVVGVFTQTAVLSSHWAAIQHDWRGRQEEERWYNLIRTENKRKKLPHIPFSQFVCERERHQPVSVLSIFLSLSRSLIWKDMFTSCCSS